MNDEAQTGVKGAGNLLLVRASSLIGHSSFAIPLQMTLKNRFPLIVLLVLLAGLLAIALAPFSVSNGLRLWVWWKSRQEGLSVSADKIDAPFLQPVVIRNLHVK